MGGVAVNYMGQQQQKKANAAALAQNQAANTEQNQAAWGNYLMQRGLAPTAPLSPGVMPNSTNSVAVNTKLPLWMTIPQSQIDASTTKFVDPRTATPATGSIIPTASGWANSPAPTAAA